MDDKKDLIIGAISNYNDFSVIKCWFESIKQSGFTGDVCVLATNLNESIIENIKKYTDIIFYCEPDTNLYASRFNYANKFLQKHSDTYRYVCLSDVRDLVFQRNISEIMPDLLKDKKIIAATENLIFKNESWNYSDIYNFFGFEKQQELANEEAYCAGLIAGESNYIKDLSLSIYELVKSSQHGGDQAAFNVLLHSEPWSSLTVVPKLEEAWCLNANISNAIPSVFQYLIEPSGVFNNSFVTNSNGNIFYIVHQYDRIQSWVNFYNERYAR